MKKPTSYIFFLLSFLFASNCNAQVQDSVQKWNIQQCFQYAIEHNIEIGTLRLNQQSNQQDLLAAKALKIPSLAASFGSTFNNSNNDASGNGTLINQLTTGGSYLLNSSIVLWNGNYINNNIRLNHLLVASSAFSAEQAVNNITLSITGAYLSILLAKENLKYIADLVNTSGELVKQGQQLYDAGSVAKLNLLQLQAQFASDKYLLVQTQNTIRQNMLVLKQILQLPTDSLFDIETPASIEPYSTIPDLKTVQQAAFRNFPEIKIGQLGIDIASLNIAKSRAGFKPVFSANASVGSGYNDIITNTSFPKTGYFTQSGNNFYQRLGFTLAVPIFSNRINKTNLEKAKIAYEQANLYFENYQLVLSQAVEQAYLDVSNATEASIAAKEQLSAAAESFRIINEQFKIGGTNAFEVLQLRNQYVQAVQAFTQAKYTAILQFKIFEFYLGNPVTL